jgi:hypothetical protein
LARPSIATTAANPCDDSQNTGLETCCVVLLHDTFNFGERYASTPADLIQFG